jgi:hypothetical protein
MQFQFNSPWKSKKFTLQLAAQRLHFTRFSLALSLLQNRKKNGHCQSTLSFIFSYRPCKGNAQSRAVAYWQRTTYCTGSRQGSPVGVDYRRLFGVLLRVQKRVRRRRAAARSSTC